MTNSGYDVTRLAHLLVDLPVVLTGRLWSNRVMLGPAPDHRPGMVGRPAWLWTSAPTPPPSTSTSLAGLPAPVRHRTHFPVLQATAGWTTPRLRDPAAADRWTWLVIAAYTQPRLARGLTDDLRRPWERPPIPTG